MTTAELLAEPLEDSKRREGGGFGRLLAATNGEIVLFGAGRLGRKVASVLASVGKPPVAFADNNQALQGTKIDGIKVFHPREAAAEWGSKSLFIITIFLPNSGIQFRYSELVALSCKHVTDFLTVGWRYPGILPHFAADLPSRILMHREGILRIDGLWHDATSREVFRQQLSWRLRASFVEIAPPVADQYFPADIIKPSLDDTFVDGGAFDGDTLRCAPWRFKRIIAVEPDPVNSKRLLAEAGTGLTLHKVLLGDCPGRAWFEASGTMASARSDRGTIEIPVATLDELLRNEKPSFIKLDIEGDELQALRGSRETLLREQPILAVCVYHRPSDLWEIPLWAHEVLPNHRLFLRAHRNDGFELVVYAVPIGRCA